MEERVALMMMVVVLMGVTGVARGYPEGAPLGACGHMYPTGHKVDAKTIEPPFTLTASTTTIAAGETVTLTLVATGDPTYPYYEGLFVQARKSSCDSDDPIGTFSVPQDDDFLKVMDCQNKTDSAVSHKNSAHQTNKTFTWTVPDTYQGRIYFRATVVKNEKNFWTNVFSEHLTYDNDTSPAPSQYCKVRSKLDESSSASALVAPLSAAIFAISVGFLWIL